MLQTQRIILAKLEERVSNWMDSTETYHVDMCDKIADIRVNQEKIMQKVLVLPCASHDEKFKNGLRTMKLMWISIGTVFGILIAHLGWK